MTIASPDLRLGSLQSLFDDIQGQANVLSGRVSTLEQRPVTPDLSQQVSTLQTASNSLQASVLALQTAIVTLQAQVAALTTTAPPLPPPPPPPVNHPPVASPIPSITFQQGVAFRVDMSGYFTDPDGDPLTLTLAGPLPPGVTFDGRFLSYDGLGGPGQTTGDILTASDGKP